MISACVVPTVKHGGGGVMVWGCFVVDSVCDLFRIQGTLNQHGYHSILQRYAIPSGLGLVAPSFVFQQDNDQTHFLQEGEWRSAASDDMASTIPRPQPNWDGLGWVGLQSEWKAANKCSACGNSFKTVGKAFKVKLVERMPRVCKAVIKAKVGYLKNIKYNFDLFNTFFGYYIIPYVLFHSFDVFAIILQCRK